jgi:hypothetical protein
MRVTAHLDAMWLVRTGRPAPFGAYRAILLQVGFTRLHVTVELRELLPHDFTLARRRSAGGMFLWHFPSSRLDRTLSCTLPYEARTFLTIPRRGTSAVARRTSLTKYSMGLKSWWRQGDSNS